MFKISNIDRSSVAENNARINSDDHQKSAEAMKLDTSQRFTSKLLKKEERSAIEVKSFGMFILEDV